MNLIVLKKRYSIYKFKSDCVLPDWIYLSDFYSITKTKDELSVIAIPPDSISEKITCSRDWRILKVAGPLDFSLIGIIQIYQLFSKRKRSQFSLYQLMILIISWLNKIN